VASSSATCYNGNACGAAITGNITSRAVFTTLANGYESSTNTAYNANGLVTDLYEYDFGSSPGNVGPLLRHTITTYNTSLGNIVDHPSSIVVTDGATPANAIAQTIFGYDGTPLTPTSGVAMHAAISGPRGNLTSVARWRNLPSDAMLTTTNWYDDTGNLIQTEDPGGHYASFHYDDVRNACGSASNPSNTNAFMTLAVNHLGQQSRTNYYPCTGQVASVRDPNDLANGRSGTTQTYDSMLRPVTTTRPDGGTTSNTYYIPGSPWTNAVINQQVAINSTTNTSQYTMLDGYGRTQRVVSANGESAPWDQVDTTYDSMGRVSFVSYPYQGSGFGTAKVTSGAGDTYSYYYANGGASFYSQVTHSDGTFGFVVSYGRASMSVDEGNGTSSNRIHKISQVDALGRTTSLCEMTSATQLGADQSPVTCPMDFSGYSGFMTTYTYDTLDDLLTVNQGSVAPHTRTYTYDSLKRLLSSNTPEQGLICYGTKNLTTGNCNDDGYDSDGLLDYRTDARNIQTNYSYDALHRPTVTTYSALNPAVHYYYDSNSFVGLTGLTNTVGRLIALGTADTSSDCGACDVFSYDSMGNVSSDWQRMSGSSSFANLVYSTSSNPRDYLGNVKQFIDAASIPYNYTYNQASRLTTVTTTYTDAYHPSTLFSAANYNAYAEPINFTAGASIGSGTKTSFSYDSYGTGRLMGKSANNSGGSGTLVYQLSSMGYANNGNITSSTDSSNGTWAYSYDDFNRLSGATKNGTDAYTYAYDRYGNRWNWKLNSVSQQSISFDSTNRVAAGNGIGYDSSGNVTSDAVSDPPNTHTYTHDAENRVIVVDSGTSTEWDYKYDALGRRIQKTDHSGNHYDEYYDLNGRLATEYYNGGWRRSEIYAGGMHLGNYWGGQTNFMFTDWLGNLRMLRDQNGDGVEACIALPFGDGASCTGTHYANQLFTGDEHDSESNTEHTDFRQMSGIQGRWLSPDPYAGSMDIGNPQSFNRYAYVMNDPINLLDPFGLDCQGATTGTGTQQESTDPNAPTIQVTVSAPCPTTKKSGCDDCRPTDDSEITDCSYICEGFSHIMTRFGNPLQHGWQKLHLPEPGSLQIDRPNCVAAWTVGGAVAGGYLGFQAGAGVGALAGAGGGTLVAPGVGTIGGGTTGAVGGAIIGGAAGALAGGTLGNAIGNAICSSGTGNAGGGSNSGNFDPKSASDRALTARQIIAKYKKGSVSSQFPGEYLDESFDLIDKEARAGDSAAQTARKLLTDSRFNK
jgi:RHS repeat-associated protein